MSARSGLLSQVANSPLTGQLFPGPTSATPVVTTAHSDYRPPPSGLSRAKAILPPVPASVLHKNACFINMQGSLTQSTYRCPEKVSMERTNGSGRMYSTNFRMDADRRLETHQTTAQDGFQPVQSPGKLGNHNLLKSTGPGPLGKTTVNPLVRSEYARSFTAADGIERGSGPQMPDTVQSSPLNTITGSSMHGSSSWGDLITTHCDTYRGQPLRCTNSPTHTTRLQQLRITSIPRGDPSKAAHPQTILQASYLPPPPPRTRYDKSEAVGAIHRSSIRLSNHTSQDQFSTTAADTYCRHHKPGRVVPFIRFPRNASFLPRGDLNPSRVKQRVTHVTTRATHHEPPSGSYPTHVDGSNLHTLSHVHLGTSPLQPIHNSTKTDSYPPISAPTLRVRAPERDNIPLNYHPGHLCRSTTADSYRSHAGVRMDKRTAQENMKKLKCSHWRLPNMGTPCYSTTHRECFRATYV